MRLFHGTRYANIDTLRPSTGGEFGPGIYLTDNEDTAKWYAHYVSRGPDVPTILVVEATLTNPFRVRKVDWIRMTERSSPSTVVKRLKKKGHDSIIGIGINDIDEQVIAWETSQVRIVSSHLASLAASRWSPPWGR